MMPRQRQKTRYRGGDMLIGTRHSQTDKAQQALRVLSPPRFKRRRVGIFSPDAVKLRQNAVVKDIEKRLLRLCPSRCWAISSSHAVGSGESTP